MDHQSTPGLFRLPRELLDMVLKPLDPLSQLCLALTCKSLFNTLPCPSRKKPKLEKNDLIAFLLLLEKDDPALVVCFDHNQLRPFNRRLGRRAQQYPSCAKLAPVEWWSLTTPYDASETSSFLLPTSPDAWEQPAVNRSSWMPGSVWPNLTFSELHLVMNRHFYGDEYGLALEHLAFEYEFERIIDPNQPPEHSSHFPLGRHSKGPLVLTPDDERKLFRGPPALLQGPNRCFAVQAWQFKHTSEARIINSELFLRRCHRVKGPPVPLALFYDLLERIDLPMCRHLRPNGRYGSADRPYPFQPRWLLEISQLRHDDDVQLARSCPTCYMDYIIVIKGPASSSGWLLELNTYHRFGSCRAPDETIWRSALQHNRSSLALKCGTGRTYTGRRFDSRVEKTIEWGGTGGVYDRWHWADRWVDADIKQWGWAHGVALSSESTAELPWW